MSAIKSGSEQVREEMQQEPVGGSETILLVDDEESILKSGEEMLSRFGYNTLSAASGEVALELYRRRQEDIDLVILDLVMPGMAGNRCLEELLRINPEAQVIVASGHTPAHQALRIEGGGTAAVYLGDLCPTAAHIPIRWGTSYDLDVLQSRRRCPSAPEREYSHRSRNRRPDIGGRRGRHSCLGVRQPVPGGRTALREAKKNRGRFRTGIWQHLQSHASAAQPPGPGATEWPLMSHHGGGEPSNSELQKSASICANASSSI